MGNFDPKKLTLVGCQLVDQQMSTPLLSYVDPTTRSGEFSFKRALNINEEQKGIMLFLVLHLGIEDQDGEESSSCDATYRCMFSYEDMADLFEDAEQGDELKKLEFGAIATLHSVAYSTVRGMFLMHLSQTPFAGAIIPIYTINELLEAETIELQSDAGIAD